MPVMTDNGLSPQEIRRLVSAGILVPVDHAKRWMASNGMNNESPPTYNQAAQNAGYALNPEIAFAQPQQRRQPTPTTYKRALDMGGRGQLPADIVAMAKARGVQLPAQFQNPANEPPRTGQPNVPQANPNTPSPLPPVAPPRTPTSGGYPQLPPVQAPGAYQPPVMLIPPSQQGQVPWWLQGQGGFGASPPPQQQVSRNSQPQVPFVPYNAGQTPAQKQPAGPMKLPKNFVVTDAMKKAAIAGMIR